MIYNQFILPGFYADLIDVTKLSIKGVYTHFTNVKISTASKAKIQCVTR